ncbi:glutamate formimidoyltransferase [Thermodesulfobacteriota bacterium]
MKLVECVPNFSEGRNRKTLDAIAAAIEGVEGVKLLDVDPGYDANRTVMTFIGELGPMGEAAFQAIRTASELIDMRVQKGEHPRMGATDVCPFVPVSGLDMTDCVRLAEEVGERVASDLGIPVYLYEYAAKFEDRRNLANIRSGEYEGLADKIGDPQWKPDFGEPRFNARAGATVIGARKFLIAYNFNLNTRDKALADRVAFRIREKGSAKRDAEGKIVRDPEGRAMMVPGRFKAVRAIGWYIPEYEKAQVSMNLTDHKVSPLHEVFEAACEEAEAQGLRVTGSELVGLIPLEVLRDAGVYFLDKQGSSPGAPEAELVRVAVHSLGLAELGPFDPKKRIIEYRFDDPEGPFCRGSLSRFFDEISMGTPTPGGGSASAAMASAAVALVSMVANLTVGKKGYEGARDRMKQIATGAQDLRASLMRAIDDDARAYDRVMEAFRLPRGNEAEREARLCAIEVATMEAIRVPMIVLDGAVRTLELAKETAVQGNVNSLSDAAVAAAAARAAAEGAYFNVLINLRTLERDDEGKRTEAEALMERADNLAEKIASYTKEKLGDNPG